MIDFFWGGVNFAEKAVCGQPEVQGHVLTYKVFRVNITCSWQGTGTWCSVGLSQAASVNTKQYSY